MILFRLILECCRAHEWLFLPANEQPSFEKETNSTPHTIMWATHELDLSEQQFETVKIKLCCIIISLCLICRVNLPCRLMATRLWNQFLTSARQKLSQETTINSTHRRIRKRLKSNWMIQSGERARGSSHSFHLRAEFHITISKGPEEAPIVLQPLPLQMEIYFNHVVQAEWALSG